MGTIRIGPVAIIGGFILTIAISFALTFLGLIDFSLIGLTFLLWYVPSLLGIAIFRQSFTNEGVFSATVIGASIVALFGIALNALIMSFFFSMTLLQAASWGLTTNLLVNVLFAGYEETGFLAMALAGKRANVPDRYMILIGVLLFLPWHALRYDVSALMYIGLLVGSRVILDSSRYMIDHSDPPFIAHYAWNILVTLFGGFVGVFG